MPVIVDSKYLSPITINSNLRCVRFGLLVGASGEELANLATNHSLVDALVVDNLRSSPGVLSELSGANISGR